MPITPNLIDLTEIQTEYRFRWLMLIAPHAYAQAIEEFDSGRTHGPCTEQAIQRDDGSLYVFVDLPDGHRIEMIVPPGSWRWRSAEVN